MCICTSIILIHTQTGVCRQSLIPTYRMGRIRCYNCVKGKSPPLTRPIACNFLNVYFQCKQSTNSDRVYCGVQHITKKEMKQKSRSEPHLFQNLLQFVITKTIHVYNAETKWEISSIEEPGVIPRCPPRRALGI